MTDVKRLEPRGEFGLASFLKGSGLFRPCPECSGEEAKVSTCGACKGAGVVPAHNV